MIIKSANLVISAASPKQFVEGDLPEIALVGRSNVGKSSLINALLNRRSLARTSNTPGKTQLLNFYLINEAFYLVDLPGYGYAAVSHGKQEGWAGLIDHYLNDRPQLGLILQLVDLRHPPTVLDKQMWEAITHWGMPSIVVATKRDKLPRSQWAKHAAQIRRDLGLVGDPLLFTTEDPLTGETLWQAIGEYLPVSDSLQEQPHNTKPPGVKL